MFSIVSRTSFFMRPANIHARTISGDWVCGKDHFKSKSYKHLFELNNNIVQNCGHFTTKPPKNKITFKLDSKSYLNEKKNQYVVKDDFYEIPLSEVTINELETKYIQKPEYKKILNQNILGKHDSVAEPEIQSVKNKNARDTDKTIDENN